MIPLNFYRDDEYVYYNNPNGITRKMSIADFETVMSGGSGGGGGSFLVNTLPDSEETAIYPLDKTFSEIDTAFRSGKAVIVNASATLFPVEGQDSTQYGLVIGSFSMIDSEVHTYDRFAIYVALGDSIYTLETDSADDYPSFNFS